MSALLFLGTLLVLIAVGMPIAFALLLNEVTHLRYKKLVQTASYMPYFISMVVAAGMVVSFIEKDGLVNQIITLLGGDPVSFRTDPKWFPVVYTVTNIWKSFGWNSILYLSAMASIDPALYESARLDGANRWQQALHITLPAGNGEAFDVLARKYSTCPSGKKGGDLGEVRPGQMVRSIDQVIF